MGNPAHSDSHTACPLVVSHPLGITGCRGARNNILEGAHLAIPPPPPQAHTFEFDAISVPSV